MYGKTLIIIYHFVFSVKIIVNIYDKVQKKLLHIAIVLKDNICYNTIGSNKIKISEGVTRWAMDLK